MKNRNSSARTAAQKSTKVETQHPSSHSNGNTFVVGSQSEIYLMKNCFTNKDDYWIPLKVKKSKKT